MHLDGGRARYLLLRSWLLDFSYTGHCFQQHANYKEDSLKNVHSQNLRLHDHGLHCALVRKPILNEHHRIAVD
ncbi:unnamed protein product [Periconia digitata]|uniref:Uncharacterized protein n=1 Tax=Periconia digitata TaxID=1303443 RepID=A0A9W4UN85_9PLEO|nr:unnamed protein product [Periconia digitata]